MKKPPALDANQHLFHGLKEELGDDAREVLETRADMIESELFLRQRLMVMDPSDRKTVLCPRRTGKTFAFATDLACTLLRQDNAKCAYITITRTQAKRNIWQPLIELDQRFQLNFDFHHTDLVVTAPRGGKLFLGGGMTEADVDRYRGLYLHKAVVDEAGSFSPDLLITLLSEVLEYCLLDTNGTLIVGGTPGVVCAGPFFEATSERGFRIDEERKQATSRPYLERNLPQWKGVDYIWSHHGWSMAENEAMPHIWEKAKRNHKRAGGDDQDPKWIREGIGKWIEDKSAFVYRYRPNRNAWHPTPTPDNPWGLPEGHKWHYVCGIDPGYDDDFSLQVAAWAPTCPNWFHVYGHDEANLTPRDWARNIRQAEAMFPGGFDVIVADATAIGKAVFIEMAEKFSTPIVSSDKHSKRDYMELLNGELVSGRAKILAGSTLEAQLKTLQWEDPRTKKRTHPKMDDHATDAYLYVFRYSMHHFARKPDVAGPDPQSPAWWAKVEADELEAAERRLARGPDSWLDEMSEKLDKRYQSIELGRLDRWMN